ncbi:hypothetical protein [Roseivirga sp.]|uniref:hypothetical protein n=1 Tax=Roseivirga sp. TaxID=1964215 RepID=UPI003B51ECA8
MPNQDNENPQGNNTEAPANSTEATPVQGRKNFFDGVINDFKELALLRVSTLIGTLPNNSSVTVEDLQNGQGQDEIISQMNLNDAMMTKIDMVSGDITTVMSQAFEQNQTLREYHSIRENQAHEIVIRNVKVLEKVGDLLIKFVKDEGIFKNKGQDPTPATPGTEENADTQN